MDAFTLIIGITLAIAGIFLYRDYARFLRGAYAKYGKVVSIHQVFTTPLSTLGPQTKAPFVKNGFYPVIEYPLEGGKVRFTAIDSNASGSFHVGDQVKLRIIKTRRKRSRTCKTLVALIAMISLLSIAMVAGAISSSIEISFNQVLLASFVITACLSVLIMYIRDQDQHYIHDLTQTKGGRTQLCLAEPTAFKNWNSALRDPVQRYKIRSTQFFGATCLGSSAIMLVFAVHPLTQLVQRIIH